MRKLSTALLLIVTAVALVPVATAQPFCEIEPCCASGAMDCCTIESAPAPAPELVLTDTVRVSDDTTLEATVAISSEEAPQPIRIQSSDFVFAESPPDRLAFLSTYLI